MKKSLTQWLLITDTTKGYIEIRNAIQTVAIATPKNIFKYITYIVV